MMTSATCLKDCEDMIRTGSSTFYKAFSFLPSPKREAVYVMYAFCRMIDDSVDEPDCSPYTLDELEVRFRELPSAGGHFIWPALRWLFASFPMTKDPFFKQMQGQRREQHLTKYSTIDQLEEYCYFVAGTVGEMLLPVLHDHPDERIIQAGIYMGKAMQIVNIIRDVGEDWRRGRRYIPLELMEQHGCSEQDLINGEPTPAICEMLEELMSIADKWMMRGQSGLDTYPPSSQFCVELAARTYMAILDQVRSNGYQVMTKRAVVTGKAKLDIMLELMKRYSPTHKEAFVQSVIS